MICTFIGHRDASYAIIARLKDVIIDLIENKNVNKFYIGNHGNFDYMVKEVLKELKDIYNISYYIVLAYIPQKDEFTEYKDTIYLDELNKVPPRFRIVMRNRIMIDKSDFVVTFAKGIGKTRDFKEYAKKQNKIIIEL